MADTAPLVSYKGFDKDWKCRGFQFAVGNEYTHKGDVKACESGFHACEYPLDVFGYYPPSTSIFAQVEQSGDLSKQSDDSKVASRQIRIVAQLSIAGLIKAAVDYTFSKALPVEPESPASATGTRGAASATGYQGAASATGEKSVAMASGYEGTAMAAEGCAIFLVYRDADYNIVHARASKVGQNGIEPGKFYKLTPTGEFQEVTNG